MFTTSDLLNFLSIGVIVGGLYGAAACLYMPPTAQDPHPGRRSAIFGAIGGGIIFAMGASLIFQTLGSLVALLVFCLAALYCLLRN